MGMDEIHQTMNVFHQELEMFNDRLKKSFDDLQKHHDHVNPLWQDAMRREYDVKWTNLEEKMKRYVTSDGVSYTEILVEKINAIRGYLYGN